MQEPFIIKKIAVLGAGVMGAQIAAHCVNAGIETLLYDLDSKTGQPNALIDKAIAQLGKLKPTPLATLQTASLLKARNYEQDCPQLADCDLIIEAIAERLDWKESLYQRISPYLSKKNILASNTSGLSINTLSNILPQDFRPHFCGMHFFNPPRYMHLVELIPSKTTSATLLDQLETWLTSYLGKGVVRAKDTPNFIANRIGVFSLLVTVHHAMAMNLGLDEVDALTGALLGRPKSATFRTMDVVGLDTMQHVIHTMQEQLTEDPWHEYFQLPEWLTRLISQGYLGQKTGQGIYKKNGSTIEVYDINQGSWHPSKAQISEELATIMELTNPEERMQKLLSSPNKQAQFLAACFKDLFHYCAYHLETIADTVRDIDLAIRWGFGWEQGPFETWQLSGIDQLIQSINQAITSKTALSPVALPRWLYDKQPFYTEQGAYAPSQNTYQPRSQLPVYKKQFFPDRVLKEPRFSTEVLYENEGVQLAYLKEDIAILKFKTKANTIGQSVLDGCVKALDRAEKSCQGLIVYQEDASNFSAGADLRSVSHYIDDKKIDVVASMIAQFQKVVLRFKYSTIPTVAALRGKALGGGCELMMHCASVVAAFESYPGLVEIGVGLLPAGGGCKEMALRAANQAASEKDLMTYIQSYFQAIAMAQVATSATNAQQMAYLRPQDVIVMHADEVLYAALAKIRSMQAANYNPPLKKPFKVVGIEGQAVLQTGLVNWLAGGFISQYDFDLAMEIVKVVGGGAVNAGTLVTEDWILQLEREAFTRLAANPLTQARILHLLKTGKPLRN